MKILISYMRSFFALHISRHELSTVYPISFRQPTTYCAVSGLRVTEGISQAFTHTHQRSATIYRVLGETLRVSVGGEVSVFIIHKKSEARLYTACILRHIRLQSTAGCFKYCCGFSEEFTWEICSPFVCT